jgi:hypothetical protein
MVLIESVELVVSSFSSASLIYSAFSFFSVRSLPVSDTSIIGYAWGGSVSGGEV